MTGVGRWGDLPVRIGSAAAMLAVGAVDIWLGGIWFQALILVVTAVMIWELLRMLSGRGGGQVIALALLSGVVVVALHHLPGTLFLPLVGAVLIAGLPLASGRRAVWLSYAPVILLAGYSLIWMRDAQGVAFLLWVIAVVVASDVCGYFAGRLLGGPKFWPRVSPKKTWSGTVAGWIGAALMGLAFAPSLGAPLALILPASVALAFAGQMGDLAESAIKRQAGVKDSSALIPGHGGLLDRFDALAGASVVALLVGGLM